MSISTARRKRTAFYLSIAGLMLVVAAISAISARDPDGVTVRTGMVLVTVGAAMWLPWQALIPVTLAVWLGPNFGRSTVEDHEMFNLNMMMELPGFLGLAATAAIARLSLRDLEQEHVLLGMNRDGVGVDPVTGVFEETQLRSAIEMELSRSRRFGRTFALVLVGIDEMRQRFDYRDEEVWESSFAATADLLRGTRANVDRVYRYGPAGFALVLPESDPKDVSGLVKRLRRVARKAKPAEGEPGGPLPAHYGATFFPTCATTVNDLIRRAEIALKISDNSASRVQIDGAEAPELPPGETLRHADEDEVEHEIETQVQEAAATVEAVPQPVLRVVGPLEDAAAPAAQVAQPVALAAQASEAALSEPDVPPATPAPMLYAVETPPDQATEPPIEKAAVEAPAGVFAYRAPEPAVDAYNRDWQAEAPLSVVHGPKRAPRLVALNGGARPASNLPADDAISDALKQLDGTLELIRSLKRHA